MGKAFWVVSPGVTQSAPHVTLKLYILLEEETLNSVDNCVYQVIIYVTLVIFRNV